MNGKIYDNIVIGAGMAGLLNAVFSASSGKSVKLITAGAGSLTIGSGLIDLLGYSTVGGILKDPFDGFSTLEAGHPYLKCGRAAIDKAVRAFLDICDKRGFPYLPANGCRFVPTAMGRLKPSFLVPPSMDMESLRGAETVYVAGVDGMKDFSPEIICGAFSSMEYFKCKRFEPLSVSLPELGAAGFGSMEAARFMDSEEGCSAFIDRLKGKINTGCGMIIPPILGSKPGLWVYERVKSELNAEICESAVIPPAVTGYRLRSMLMGFLGDLGVELAENARVISAEVKNGRCISVSTAGPGGVKSHRADNFTVASGGFYGGGLTSAAGRVWESVFGLPVKTPDGWASADFSERQNYSGFGVSVNDRLNACDILGKPVYENVYFAGRIIAGADSPYEHSGNGVALATSYLAASLL